MPEVIRLAATDTLEFVSSLDSNLIPDEKNHRWMFWLFASIHQHFEDRKGDYDVYIEGDERTLQEEAEFAELRVDGPFILQVQKRQFFVDVEVNVLIQTHMDPRDLYRHQRMVGWFTKLFTNTICLYRYGDEDFDKQDLLGSLNLQRDNRETVDVNYYGIIKQNSRLIQSTIEGHYRIDISNLES